MTVSAADRSPETSIIIRAFNEERWLPHVLAAIARQSYKDFEVVLVDSGSVDRTRDIAASHGARIVTLRLEDFTFGHSLNVGIRSARGQFLALLSAHAIPTDDEWLARLVRPLRQPAVAMVFGGQRGHPVSKFSESRDFERIFPHHPQVMDDDHVFVNNANSAVKRARWEEHPFDEGLPGLEDAEWAKYWIPRGHQVLYEPTACIYHVHTESWPQVRHRFYREGIAGRWTAVRIMRHIPREVAREVHWCLLDIATAIQAGVLRAHAGDIWRYRYNKTMGIVRGILDSRRITNPSTRARLKSDQSYSALVIRGPHSARVEPRPLPDLKPAEVLIRIAFVGVCGTDLELASGRLGYYRSGMAKYPIVPGHELSGQIVGLGAKVDTLQVGDRVVVECIQGCGTCAECKADKAIGCAERREVGVLGLDGGCAEYLVSRARYVHRIPEGVTLAEAALIEPLAVALKVLRRIGASGDGRPRQCGVVGAGPIGHLITRILAHWGHAVTVFDRNPARLDALADVSRGAQEIGGMEAMEWLVEATGSSTALAALLERSPTGATVALVGLPYGTHPFSFEPIVTRDKTLVGSVGSSAADYREALRVISSLDTHHLLGHHFSLQTFADAWEAAKSQSCLKPMIALTLDVA